MRHWRLGEKMPITGVGWEFLVQRLGIHQSTLGTRTYGTYQAYRGGQPVDALSGNVCESPGPGENDFPASEENPRRIEQGRYPLWTQFGENYRTIGYTPSVDPPGQTPMPGVLLGSTGNRTAILIHPGHPPTLYLSSIGCLNLTSPVGPNQAMDFLDSRSRVIAVIGDLQSFAPASFVDGNSKQITNAWIVIDGEPMNVLPDQPSLTS
jgi:hypothetical protein